MRIKSNIATSLKDYLVEVEKGNTLNLSQYSMRTLNLYVHTYVTVDLNIESNCYIKRGSAGAICGTNNFDEIMTLIPCDLFIQFTQWIEAYGHDIAQTMLKDTLNNAF